MMNRARRRYTTWIAVMAILWMAFAPVLSQAFAASSAQDWADICRTQAAGSGSQPTSPDTGAAHALEHCPYCFTHHVSLGLPPANGATVQALVLSDVMPRAFLAAPRRLYAWVSAQPRAPPSA